MKLKLVSDPKELPGSYLKALEYNYLDTSKVYRLIVDVTTVGDTAIQSDSYSYNIQIPSVWVTEETLHTYYNTDTKTLDMTRPTEGFNYV